jgi:hypothetical protein
MGLSYCSVDTINKCGIRHSSCVCLGACAKKKIRLLKSAAVDTGGHQNALEAYIYRVFKKDGPNFKPLYFTMATCYNYTKNYKRFSEPSSFTNHFINALCAARTTSDDN